MKYGFIGCGNMGGAIAKALSKATKDIAITDRSGKAKSLAKELGCQYTDAQTIATNCERIFLAVKPQMMESVLYPLREILSTQKPLIITMAAGLTTDRIEAMCGTSLPVLRIMPNTPVIVGKGMIPYCCNRLVDSIVLESVLEDLRFAGKMDALDEELMDASTALSGSGPAYMYLFLEALADSAIACGLPGDKALVYAAMTMAGAAEMAITSGKDPGVLKDAVCSPGGSTIEGINALEENGFRETIAACVRAAYHKNIELGK